jgi:hypothetical protein
MKIPIHVGNHTEFYNAVQKDASGGLRKLDFAPTVGIGLDRPFSSGFHFLPEADWVLPQTKADNRIITNTFLLRADVGYDLFSWLRPRIGSSLIWHNIHGRGGKVNMNNGTSTSTFYYPEENRTMLNNTLDFGLEFLHQAFAVRFQSYVYSVFKSEQRQYSYTLFITYYWSLP